MNWLSSHLELIATLCGLANIYLVARASMWNWFFGIATVSLYLVIFMHVKLYADMSLQLVFLILQFYGIYCWALGGSKHQGEVVTQIDKTTIGYATCAFVILFISIACTLNAFTDSTTIYLDSITTSLSLVAQWMMSKKYIEHWWVWLVVNIISVDMYITKSLYFTSGLYAVFIILNFYGFKIWLQLLRDNHNEKKLKCVLSK